MNNELMKTNEQQIRQAITSNVDVIKPLKSKVHLIDTFVSGISYLTDQSIVDNITADTPVKIQRDINNPFDPHAIRVIANDQTIGYVWERDNHMIANLMDGGKLIEAEIKDIDHLQYISRIRLSLNLIDF